MKKQVNKIMKSRYRSKLEERISDSLLSLGDVVWTYEGERLFFTIPESEHFYTPDFVIEKKNGENMYLECKGRHRFGGMDLPTRKKMKLIRKQYPDTDIRLLFDKAGNKIGPSPKSMTWEQWADKHSYKYTIKDLPLDWIKELK